MNIKSFRQLALFLVLPITLVTLDTRVESQSSSSSPNAESPLVHHPATSELEKLEPEIRQHLISLRNSLTALAKGSATNSQTLSAAYGQMAQTYHTYSLASPAKECYLNASRLAPKDYRWVYLLGNLSQQENRIEDAINYYNRARELRHDYLAAPVNLGNLYLQQNRLAEAGASFREATALNAQCAAAWYGLGQIALSNRTYAEAVDHLEKALANAPEANRIHYALAMAYRGLGKIEQARAALEKQGAIGVRVSDPLVEELQELVRGERLHLLRGRLAFDALRYDEAAEAFRKAVAANPKSVTAHVNLGAALAQVGNSTEAIEQYSEVLRLDSNNAAAHYNLGLLLSKLNQHERAITHLQTAVSLNPADTEAHFLLAQELLKSERAEEALTEFSRVTESDPANPVSEDALLESVKLLLRKKQYAAAIERLNKAQARFPQNGRTAVTLAYLLAASPQTELRDGQKALALATLAYQSTGLVNHGAIVAMALAELGRCNDAAEWQRKMIASAEQNKQTDLVGKLKADLQRYEKASPCRQQGEIISPESTVQPPGKKP